ncbi:MAG TPA: hypothetical protein VFC47_03590 [Caulobacteraceae bacterium]|nr:hypothetical protein [Caulobacteraceae bacterium]
MLNVQAAAAAFPPPLDEAPAEPRETIGGGLVAFDGADLARRARDWREIATDAEERFAWWRRRGECANTIGAIGRAAGWAAARPGWPGPTSGRPPAGRLP